MVVFCYNAFKYFPMGGQKAVLHINMGYNVYSGATPAKNMPSDTGCYDHPVSEGIFITVPIPLMRHPTPSRMKRFSAGILPRDMRLLLQARNMVYFGAGADQAWLNTFENIRRDYISRVGLRQYLLDMLPPKIAGFKASQCTAVLADGTAVRGKPDQLVIDFLLNFSEDTLPYQIHVRRNENGRIENLTYSL